MTIVIVYHSRWSCANHRRVVSQAGAVSMIVLAGVQTLPMVWSTVPLGELGMIMMTNDHRSLMITLQECGLAGFGCDHG